MNAAGWYHAEGDPPGTTRYWDGERWVGDPQYSGGAAAPAASPIGNHQLAGAGARIGARLIDFIIAGVIFSVLLGGAIVDIVDGIDALGPNPEQAAVERVVEDVVEDSSARVLLFTAIGVFWDFLWVALLGGTPGKLMLGLRVARADSGLSPPGWGKAALRALNRVVALVPLVGLLAWALTGLASLIMLFADDKRRTVMDRIASTVVVRK